MTLRLMVHEIAFEISSALLSFSSKQEKTSQNPENSSRLHSSPSGKSPLLPESVLIDFISVDTCITICINSMFLEYIDTI
jgi:hypothetical protein